MGCDIHLYVERRVNGVWESAEDWQPVKDDPDQWEVPYDKRYYSGRNYDLFAILADVRNGRGFAGVETGEGFQPISEPRGMPADASPRVAQSADAWGVDGHSHSHLTVAEIMAFDWTQVTKSYGMMSASEFWRWNQYARGQGEPPETYSGDVWGDGIQKIGEPAMTGLLDEALKPLEGTRGGSYADIEKMIDEKLPKTFTRCQWDTPYYRAGSTFLGEVLPRLWRLGKPEDVRIVFWFDN